ncbi:MAG: OsmC family protein [Myxococcales bacterium]
MKVLLHSEEALTLGAFDSPGLEVEAAPGAHAHYSAFQMFTVGIGLCTASVLSAYGAQIGVPTDQLTVRIAWTLGEKPRRIGTLDMQINWPGLPDSRLRAAELAAAQCPLHRTLELPPKLSTSITNDAPVPEFESGGHHHDHHGSAHES